MRGTKHDASQHQRRGIRSRLIASVAAVAMLATSIAAGTAVAADIDETDPTQQNTIVEQPQQGTENAGDQTGEQNTESEGDQTDQPQESGDTATETESDTTTEADSTEEADPKADADKADGEQSSEKQSAAVPAPLAAESRASTHVDVPDIIENVESTNDKIHVNLFDYDKGSQNDGGVNYKRTGGYYTRRNFLFGDETGTINTWTKENGGVRQGIVADNLTQSGYPRLADEHGRDDLGYLFNPEGQTKGVELKGTDVDGLFRQDEDGYYYFDSADNFAKFDKGSNSFKLYERGRFDNFDDITGAVGHGAFLPFNDLKRDGDNYIYSGNTFDGLHGYRLEGDNRTGDNTDKSSVDYFFGMTVSADFYMPDGRQVDGKDIVFEFEGDDDVWVFVDGKLVLDLGGIHDNYSGSINFTTGAVTVTDDNNAGDQDSLEHIYGSLDSLENKTHELKVFYLERGAGGSNCKFRFNLPAVPTSGEDLSVAKAVSGDVDSDAPYTMNVLLDGTSLYTGKYQLYTLSGQKVEGEQTANGGAIVVKAGQYATLTDSNITKDTKYVVREVADSARGFQVTATGNGTGDITMSSQPDDSVQSGMLTVSKDSFVTVVNTKPLGVPEHSKKIGDNGDGTYTLALDVIGKNSEETQVTTTPLDISLVLDVSGSMADYMEYEKVNASQVNRDGEYYIKDGDTYRKLTYQSGWYNGWYYNGWYYNGDRYDPSDTQFYKGSGDTKLAALKAAVNSFASATAEENKSIQVEAAKHRISLVKFSGNTYSDGDDTYWEGQNEWNHTQILQGLTSNMNQVTSAVNGLRAVGGTYSQNGLQKASEALAGARENAKKVVIFFTDGEPGKSGWDGGIAAQAINEAHGLKNETNATVYSIGVFGGANPDDTSGNFNRFMNAVSSNYPDAECTNRGNPSNDFKNLNLGDKASGDAEYYFAATNAEELDAVFEGIQSSITTGASYSNVAIVDELSQWAQVDPETVKYKTEVDGDGFHEVTSGVTLKVQKPGNDGGWVTVNPGDDGYPEGVRLLYKPAADGAADSTGTVKAVFGADYKLRQGWKYTLEFKVVPTDQAYSDYADSGYGKVKGEAGTDLYTDATNTPKGGVSNTSVGKPGFRSNKNAYVEYTSAGKPDQAPYDHPVLQVKTAEMTVSKQWKGGTDHKPVTVHLYDDGTDTGRKLMLQADGWTGTFDGLIPGHTYTVVEDSVRGYTSSVAYSRNGSDAGSGLTIVDSDVLGVSHPDLEATVTNALETRSVPLLVEKNLIGRDWDGSDSFTFLLTPIGENADKAPGPSGNQVPEAEDGWLLTVKASDVPLGDDVRMHKFEFDVPFSEEPYTYTIREVTPDDPELGMTYSEVVWKLTLYANTDTGYNFGSPERVDGSDDDSGERSETRGMVQTVEFTNTYVAPVSSLPLTGGRSTARTLLLAGGGVLLVAGAAWLLARRRQV
ncbi:DUF7604 domain-containing protein [Bifidobacterium pullorum]|uniref:DUF7604 domain-containing protein n=1 Tax=Bifidobacterium pullorum TaxID=78448 RepID=UPI000529660B|nr:fibro-slime domain-containing protein [Bifidobacterium pullorum]